MIFSKSFIYGMQAILYLARHDTGPVLSRKIAEDLNMPQPFLAKILQELASRGLLQSFRGRGGIQTGTTRQLDQGDGSGGDDRG